MQGLIKIRKVAEQLGLSQSCVYQMAQKGKIPCVKLNGYNYRFDQSAINHWVESKTRKEGTYAKTRQ